MDVTRYINRAEAAQYLTNDLGLQISKNTLSKWVTTGGGPVYRRFGKRAVYLVQDLNDWALQKLSQPRISSAPRKSVAA